MKIGILGGTFDPVHQGHLILAESAKSQYALDKVIFVPAYLAPHKTEQKVLTSCVDRYNMTELALKNTSGFEVSDCEISRAGISYTIDTLRYFKKIYPDAQIFLIMGEDTFKDIDTWREAGEIKKIASFLVMDRLSTDLSESMGATVQRIKIPFFPLSSSEIRVAIQKRENLNSLLNPSVEAYIREKCLYNEEVL